MTPQDIFSRRSETDTNHRSQLCAVCPHFWNAHDAIAVRFCAATMARALTRGCVCRDQATGD
jgi:hypothetical protein